MQIVKLNVKMEFKQMKVLVDMNPQQQLTVLSFLKRFVDVCGINHVDPQDFQLYDGQFILPHQLPAFWINDKKTYSVVQTIRDKKTIIKQKQIQKQCKIRKKQSKIQSSSSSSSSLDSSSSSQSISVSSSDLQNFRKHKKKIGIQKKPMQKKQKVMKSNIIERVKKFQQFQTLEQEDKVKKPQIKPEQMKRNANWRGGKANPIQKQERQKKVIISSESSESSSEKPAQYRQKVRQIVQHVNEKTKKQQQQRKNMMKAEIDQKQKPATVAKAAIKVPMSVRKNMSNDKQKNEQQEQNKQEEKKVDIKEEKPQQKQKQKLTFKQYQQAQWLPISKNELNLWKEQCQNQPILCPGNQIRFKVMELDQEKFVPVTSGWITGFVTTVQDNSAEVLICFKRVTQEQKDGGKQKCIDNYEIPFHNMQQLQVRKISLDSKQSEVLEKSSNKKQKKVQNTSKTALNVQKVEQKEKVKQQSLQQFICGQIHFYFGQKNYPTDLFMQMHANNDENKYINYKLMLNFPKIKKVLADENKLWEYLINDDKLASRNYQLDINRKMIRRK